MSSAVGTVQKVGKWLLAVFVAVLIALLLLGLLGWVMEPKNPKTSIILTRQDLAGVKFLPRQRDLDSVAKAKGCEKITLPTSLKALAADDGVAADCWRK
jgi:hypothetical protein